MTDKQKLHEKFHDKEDEETSSSIQLHPHCCAPAYLKFNPYITHGYRGEGLLLSECVRSSFASWSNETLNCYTHLVGFCVFLYEFCLLFEINGRDWSFLLGVTSAVAVSDVNNSNHDEGFNNHDTEKLYSSSSTSFSSSDGPLAKNTDWGEEEWIKSLVLLCFMSCTLLSTLYHTFCCISDRSYRRWLTVDMTGVAAALLGIYCSGIYIAYRDNTYWLAVHLAVTSLLFLMAMTAQFLFVAKSQSDNNNLKQDEVEESHNSSFHWRLFFFTLWAVYGVIPTLQWVVVKGLKDQTSQELLHKIIKMYALSAAAFGVYIFKVPERFSPGKFNYVGHSHQLWHILIFSALYYWYIIVIAQHKF